MVDRETIELRMAEIWREELFVQDVSHESSFLGLGGASLAAISVADRVCAEYPPLSGQEACVYGDLLESETLRECVERLVRRMPDIQAGIPIAEADLPHE
jgi:hypothetical protein